VALEVKRADKWDRSWEKPMKSLKDNPGLKIDRLIGVYSGSRSYQFDDLSVFPLEEFTRALFAGEIY
jgi:hypothetical protein